MRVGKTIYYFAQHLGLKHPERLFLLGCLHDIGKIRIPPSILHKPSALSDEEFALLKRHTLYGAIILKNLDDFTEDEANVILYHHENVDGSGYHGQRSADIPLLSKIIRIVDSYDTMVFGRTYQESLYPEKAIQELQELADFHYDRRLVQAFVAFLNKDGIHRQTQNSDLKQVMKSGTMLM